MNDELGRCLAFLYFGKTNQIAHCHIECHNVSVLFWKIWKSRNVLIQKLTPNTRILYTDTNICIHQQSYLQHIYFIVFAIVWVYLKWRVTCSSPPVSMFSLRTDLCKSQLTKQHRYSVSLLTACQLHKIISLFNLQTVQSAVLLTTCVDCVSSDIQPTSRPFAQYF